MRHGHVIGIDWIVHPHTGGFGREVRNYLMAVEVEVDPTLGTATLFAAEHSAVKAARLVQVMDGKCEMEWMHRPYDNLFV